jgi:hypothetical protein
MLKALLVPAAVLAFLLPAAARGGDDAQTHGMTPGGHGRHMHRDWSTPGQHRHSVCWHNHYGRWVWVCR